MNIDTHYKQFWSGAIKHFKAGRFEYDPFIDDENDNRFGITVLVRPGPPVRQSIGNMLRELEAAEPGQYYYPAHDLHVTILSVISCYNGFTPGSFNPEDYKRVIKKSLENIKPFKIHFQGITASPSCIMVQGYPDGMLNLFRKNLREHFASTNLQTSFDTRYTIILAHSTVMRFKQPLQNSPRFIQLLEKYRHYEFGTTLVTDVEFVYNNWYQQRDKGHLLAAFPLERAAYI